MRAIFGLAAILLASFVSIDDSFAQAGGGHPHYVNGKHTKSHGGDYIGGQGNRTRAANTSTRAAAIGTAYSK